MTEQERTEEKPCCPADFPDGKHEWCCTLDEGHEGDHEAHGWRSATPLRTWPNEPPPPPRVWSLPAEPGPEVTRLREEPEGSIWLRHPGPAGDFWYPAGGDPDEDGTDWDELLAAAWPSGRLTDATPTEEPKP